MLRFLYPKYHLLYFMNGSVYAFISNIDYKKTLYEFIHSLLHQVVMFTNSQERVKAFSYLFGFLNYKVQSNCTDRSLIALTISKSGTTVQQYNSTLAQQQSRLGSSTLGNQ